MGKCFATPVNWQFRNKRFFKDMFWVETWGCNSLYWRLEAWQIRGLSFEERILRWTRPAWYFLAGILETKHFCWILQASQFFEREFWRAKICAGHLGPANFEAGASENILGSNLKLANLRASDSDSGDLCWTLGACQSGCTSL